jgi:uncharacterized protein (TIGR03437 family)
MIYRAAFLLLLCTSLFAADFQNGQAARAVLGQTSFTSRDPGINITSMTVSAGRLYAADASHHVLTFDLSQLPGVRDDFALRQTNGCGVCGFNPVAVTNESVMPGVAAVSVRGKAVAVADTSNHRVLIWRDATAPRPGNAPDIVLGSVGDPSAIGPATLSQPVSVALDGKRVFVGDVALHRVLVWNSYPLADNQPADVVLGQPDALSVSSNNSPTPDSISSPAALVSDGTNLFVADSLARRILIFSPGDSPLASDAVANSASLLNGPLAPGTLVSVNGKGLSETSDSTDPDKTDPLPKRLGGTELILDGQPLPLLAVTPNQVQAQLPYDLGGRAAATFYVRTEHAGGAVSVTTPISLKLVPASPGLFAFSGTEPRAAILLHSAGIQSGPPVTEESPAKPGEIVTIWATGLGSVVENGTGPAVLAGTPHEGPAAAVSLPISAQVDGQPAQVISAKLPQGAVGVYQIEIAVPQEQATASEARLSITQNGFTSNTVTFPQRVAPQS